MHFFEFTVESEDKVAPHRWINTRVIYVFLLHPRVLLPRLDHSQVLLGQQIDHDLISLLAFKGSEHHLHEDGELFEAASFVCDLLHILLFVLSAPD